MASVVFHAINSVTATLANLLILVTMWRTPSLHVPPNTLLFCLAVSDFCVGCIAEPVFINVQVLVYNNVEMVSCTLKTASFFLNLFLSTVALLAMTVISIDRYLAVYLHLRYREIVTDTRTRISIFAIWVVGGAIPALVFLPATKILQWTLIIVVTLCLLTALYIWIYIYLVVKHHQAQIQHQIHTAQGQQFNMLRFRKSADKCVLLVFLYLLCYLPQVTFLARLLFNVSENSSFVGFHFCYTLVALNSTLNPLVYCWRNRDIRTAAKQTLMKITCNVQVQ